MVVGILECVYTMLSFNVTVPNTIDGVTTYWVNQDLLQQRELYVIMWIAVAVIGAIVFVAGLLKPGATVTDLSPRQ